ncbi:hypothetical protein [Rufibacter latericius]|uniref:Uncharacterized protein n=1 Tax=Rufibacter latericius TaxID=2487040 RepID=A0A3M9MYK1_9BACT|nr:hypothetical protein [Rufibacter latericius]RNI30560.1 hypothetical protein EFB08_04715 [Rufibacter latericius]
MKKLLLLALLSCCFFPAQAQKILVKPYVLGLVDDFEGRNWAKDNPEENTLVDKFHSTEVSLVTYLDSLIKEENKRTYDKVLITNVKWEKKDCYYCQEFRRIMSKQMVAQMHEAYSFKWKDLEDEKHYKIYTGVLKPKFLEKDQERYSFLAGAYVRYGSNEEDLYSFKLSSSKSKFDAILRELKTLKCTIKKVDVKEGETILQQVTFIPSPNLKAYLDKQERLRLDILRRKEKHFKERNQGQNGTDLFSAGPEQD